ncbi:unnamed protein product [Lactuca virosa]|uniref:GTD-binding domain-containing protein n=1 Tax=Lactuca virosa TaxID=75947 RepID=A0AAU9PCJ8_9ASTR|nr:unnamed protein product [Lactuca virosa]
MATTKGLIDHLLLATCEWFLMFWVFIDAALAYSLTKFARYCDLQIPCLLCSRLDHFFDKEEPGSYFHLFCNKHQEDISYLIYCNLHNELVDIREICEDCLHSQSNLECYRFVVDKNLGCMGSSIRTCSCCKRQWKEKPSGQTMIDPHMVGSRGCNSNVTTKPPLPRVGPGPGPGPTRRVRSRHGDGVRRIRNKTKNRHHRKYSMSPGSYSDANITSESEFELLFSDDDDGSLIMRGVTNGGDNRNKIFGRHSYSTPDFGSLLVESQLHEPSVRTRSTSVTPNVARSLRRSEENNPYFKPKKYMNPSPSSSMDGCMASNSIGSQNQCRISSRHSYSACDLGSAILMEMQLNSLPRRSASVTPNSSGHGFGEFKWPKCQTQPASSHETVQNYLHKAKKSKKSSSSTSSMRRSGSYGHFDDSSISCNTDTQNRNKIPRRHSYSVFQLGCEILLNMPTDEPLTSNSSASFQQNGSFGYGFQDPNSNRRPVHSYSYSHSQDLDSLNAMLFPIQRPNNAYGSMDDSFVSRTTGNQCYDHSTLPRRHSYSFFEIGCEILLNMPNDETLTNPPASITPNPMQFPNKRAKRAKKNPSPYLHKSDGPSSWDDSVISHNNTGNQNGNRNSNPRRHSYSALELGCALLFELQKDESLKRPLRSASMTPNPQIVHGLGEQNKTKFKNRPNYSRSHNPFLDRNHGNGSLDDSVVPRNNSNRGQNTLPRRHSYSVFQLGGDILLNMPHDDESVTSQSSFFTPNGEPQRSSIFHIKNSPCHSPEKHKSRHPHPLHHNGVPLHPPTGSVKRFSLSSDVGNDFSTASFLDKNIWHGSMDDSVVYRSMNNQNQNNVPRRHSYSAFDLGRALLVEMNLDESLKRSYPSPAPNYSSGHGLGEFHQPNFQNKPNTSSSQRKAMPWPRSDGYGSCDDSFISRNAGNHNQNENRRRHSYSALELECALLLDMHLKESAKRRRSASVTPSPYGHHFEEPRNSKIQSRPGPIPQPTGPAHPVNGFGSSNNYLFNNNNDNRHHGSLDDSVVSHGRGNNRKRYRKLVKNSYSVSDLTSPSLEMPMEEGFTSKSASLTPSCSIGQGLGGLDWLQFQTGTTSVSPELDSNQLPHKKRKKERAKAKKGKRPLQQSGNNGGGGGGGDLSMDNTNWYDAFDDPVYSNDTGSRNRYAIFSRNSQSANDLGSVLLEMHLDDSIRSRSKSLTPNSSIGYGSQEEKWSKSQIKPSPSLSPERQFHAEKPRRHDHLENERDKKHLPPLIPTKDADSSTNIRTDACSMCSERMDARSLDGSTYTEMEVDGIVEIVKKKAEDDVRCLRLLQSELEAERNAATIAANHAMNMITRLQQEKASLQMEALQYLRMMEEQAEYDMEALQKANELVEEKENEIQDLLDELEQYRIRYGDLSMGSIHVPIIIFENEKRYILESLSTLEKKLHQLGDGGDHLNDDNSFLTPKDSATSNGVFDKCHEIDSATMEHELVELKEKIEGLQADIELVKHACNSLHGRYILLQKPSLQLITHFYKMQMDVVTRAFISSMLF